MKGRTLLALFLVFVLSVSVTVAEELPEYEDGMILVKFKSGVTEEEISKTHENLGSRVLKQFKRSRVQSVEIRSGLAVMDAVDLYQKNPSVEFAEPDFKVYPTAVPNDERFPEMWALEKIEAPAAWDISTGSDEVIVAVLENGVDYTHPDLAQNMWMNSGEAAFWNDWGEDGQPGTSDLGEGDGIAQPYEGNGVDDDDNGYIDDFYGINAVSGDGDPIAVATHGTGAAGIIGAVGNNSIGVVGVNWNVKLMAFDRGQCITSDILECLEYVLMMKERGNNVRVTNNSYGMNGFSDALYNAIKLLQEADILFVAAAGNFDHDNDVNPRYPASCDLPNVISVAASDQNDEPAVWTASSTNYGATSVDVAAPGKDLLTTCVSWHPDGLYMGFGGTSGAAPHVSGLAALILSVAPDMTWDEVKSLILGTVDYCPGFDLLGDKPILSQGRINARKALQNICNSEGGISLDKEVYGLPVPVKIGVSDCDLNLDPNTKETVIVSIASNTELAGEQVLLTEVGTNAGYFHGYMSLSLTNAPGVLWVSHGDTLTASYQEQIPSGTRTATATVDANGPIISGVEALLPASTSRPEDDAGIERTIVWTTNENASTIVYFGDSVNLGQTEAIHADKLTNHSIRLSNLMPNTTYFFDVESVDENGNITREDNNGQHYTFVTPCPADISFSTRIDIDHNEQIEVPLTNDGCEPLDFQIEPHGYDWLTVFPEQGTVLPNETITLTFITVDAPGGKYDVTITTGGDPDEPSMKSEIWVPLGCWAPKISISPLSLRLGQSDQLDIVISNNGCDQLDFQVEPHGYGWLTVSPEQGSLQPDQTMTLSVTTENAPVPSDANFTISSNDPEASLSPVPLVIQPQKFAWFERYDGPASSSDQATDMWVRPNGNTFTVGHSYGGVGGLDIVLLKRYKDGSLQYAIRWDSNDHADDYAYAVARASGSRVIVVGGKDSAKKGMNWRILAFGNAGAFKWQKQYNGPASKDDLAVDVTVDGNDNAYVAGWSTNEDDTVSLVVQKYAASSSAPLWTARYPTHALISTLESVTKPVHVAVDQFGSVYLAGTLQYFPGNGNTDYVVLKYTSSGQLYYEAIYNGPYDGADELSGLVVDTGANVYVTGKSQTGEATTEICTIKYNASGNEVWRAFYEYDGDNYGLTRANAITLDSGEQNVFVAGWSYSGNHTVKYDSNGNEIWNRTWAPFGDGAVDQQVMPFSMVVDGNGNVIVTGQKSYHQATNIFTIAYDPDGCDPSWIYSYPSAPPVPWQHIYCGPGNGTDWSMVVGTDDNNNFFVTGHSLGEGTGVDFVTLKYPGF